MSSSLVKFQGRPWSEIIIRQKLNVNEILLSKDKTHDLLRCRHCRRVIKCGYVDIHLKKCAQHYSNLPAKNPSSAKITLAKYYYDILPIDNSNNTYCHSIPEPPHKKRKVNKTKNKTIDNDVKIIPPPSMRTKNRNKRRTSSIYTDLYHGLRSYQDTLNTKKQRTKSIKKKLKLRLNRPSKSTHNIEHKSTKDTASLEMMRDQKMESTKRSHTMKVSSHPLTLTSAWEREEDIITENIKAECSINYVTYHQFWNQYANALDKYAVECTTRSNTKRLKTLDQQISRYNSHQAFRPVIKHLLEKNHYKEGGREFEDYQSLRELVGISYNIPNRFSNGICPPQEDLKAFVDRGKYQSCLQSDEHKFWFKTQPLSPLRYISKDLHNNYIRAQQHRWRMQQQQQPGQVVRPKQTVKPQQDGKKGKRWLPLVPGAASNATGKSNTPYNPVYGYRNGPGTGSGAGAGLIQNIPNAYTQRAPVNMSMTRNRIASHSSYNGHSSASINGDVLSINGNHSVSTLQRQGSYGSQSSNSVSTQQTQASHGSMGSMTSRGSMNPYSRSTANQQSVPVNGGMHSTNNRTQQQAHYPSYAPIANVPSPFVNTGSAPPPSIRNTPQSVPPPNMNSAPYICNYRNNGHTTRRGNSQTPRPLMRPPSYENNALHYNASPSDTAITALSVATYPHTASSQPPIPLNTHINANINNINNNPSPQSINSNHTSYTGISNRSATPMGYPTNNNSVNSNNGSNQQQQRLYSSASSLIVPPSNGLQRGNTNEAEMYMPSIGRV